MLHLLLGVPAAGVPGWLGYPMSLTVIRTGGLARVVSGTAVLIGLGLICWLVTVPAVREVSIPVARSLLSVQLPDAVDPTAWVSRRRGLGWVLLISVMGPAAVLALLIGVPAGLSLWTAAAARVLGPGPRELLVVRQREFAATARRHELARQLHDTIGHSLTAIGVQAEALVAVVDSDPTFAIQAARDIRDRARYAVADLHHALGLLRQSASDDDTPSDPRALVADFPGEPEPTLQLTGDLAGVDPSTVGIARHVVREALTNAARHSCGPATVQVEVLPDELSVRVQNRIDQSAPVPGPGPTDRSWFALRAARSLLGRTTTISGCWSLGSHGRQRCDPSTGS